MGSPAVVAEVKQVLYHWWNGAEPESGARHFGVTAQVLIGPADSELADSFDCILCSPSMFADRFEVAQWGSGHAEDVLPGGEVLPVHGVWLMKSWSSTAFESAVERLITAMSPGPDWQTVAARIGRHLPWEYDYKHDDEVNERAGLARLAHSFWHDDWPPGVVSRTSAVRQIRVELIAADPDGHRQERSPVRPAVATSSEPMPYRCTNS